VVLFATTTGYQTRSFGEAAARVGVDVVLATDRCKTLDDPWRDQAIPVRFHDERVAARTSPRCADAPFTGVLAVGDRPVPLAAAAASHLELPWHPPEAAAASRNKQLARARWRAAGLPVPWFLPLSVDADPDAVAPPFPCVVKPLVLSGSRGVIRADDPAAFRAAFARVRALLRSREVKALREPEVDTILVEEYLPGDEYAVEGVLDRGALRVLAIFDKPDPLTGPYFEETIYVTPSRAAAARQQAIETAVAEAARALGLWHGPCTPSVASTASVSGCSRSPRRPIGGLCARALRFSGPAGEIGPRGTAAAARGRRGDRRLDARAPRLWRDDGADPRARRVPARRRGGRGARGPRRRGRAHHGEGRPGAGAAAGGRSYLGFIFARDADDFLCRRAGSGTSLVAQPGGQAWLDGEV
jgi:hypothetical protein